MLLVTCPNCGERNAAEFHCGGEYHARPRSAETERWTSYLYMKTNSAGRQTEWWFHRAGCGLWFLVERNTSTNQIFRSYLWHPDATVTNDE